MTTAQPYRSRFMTPHGLKKDRDLKKRQPRLMDLNTVHCLAGDSRFFAPVEDGEFCVVDTVTREKAWFEWFEGWTTEDVRKAIEGHFAVSAFRITSRIWAV